MYVSRACSFTFRTILQGKYANEKYANAWKKMKNIVSGLPMVVLEKRKTSIQVSQRQYVDQAT